MPYDPTKPANGSPLSSAEMRGQLQSLNQDTQSRATVSQMVVADNAVLQQTSANTNAVDTLNISASSTYDEALQQEIINKINELILAQRR